MSFWNPYTPEPHLGPRALLTRAEGAYVFDDGGRRYGDGTASWWCNVHGHCHPRLVEALHRQARTLDQVLVSPHAHPTVLALSEELLASLGGRFHKVFYSDDGSTAVEAALKMALQYWANRGETGRTAFLAMERAYHGDTLGAVAISHVDEFHRYFQTVKMPVHRIPVPSGEEALRRAEALIGSRGREIAALIVEPLILGAGGMIFYPPAALERLVAACRRQGIVVIFDEVFTGFGRTGKFFAMDHVREAPDIVCLSKGLTSGMLALGATAVHERIHREFTGGAARTFHHGHTFTANALACAVARESLRLFREENVLARNERLAAVFAELAPRFRALPRVADCRHLGMVFVVELKAADNGPGWRVASALWDKGLWVRPLHNLLYLVPPYCVTESELREWGELLYGEVHAAEF